MYSASVIMVDENSKTHEELKYIEYYKVYFIPCRQEVLIAKNIRF